MEPAFTHQFRVRYAEVDLQSVVFNSRYLEYADLIITEYWRAIDLHFAGGEGQEKDRANDGAGGLEFHVVRAEIDFTKPIRSDEIIEGRATTQRVGNTSITTLIELWGTGEEADLRSSITLVHVHVDLESGQPVAVPDFARARLQSHVQPHRQSQTETS